MERRHTRKLSIYTAMMLSVVISVALTEYLFLDLSFRQQVSDTMKSWAKSEMISIQEGRFAEVASKLHVFFEASGFAEGFALSSDVASADPTTFIQLGQNDCLPKWPIILSPGEVKVEAVGFFRYCMVQSLAPESELVLSGYFHPKNLPGLFFITLGIISLLVLITTIVLIDFEISEHKNRFRIIFRSLSFLIDTELPTHRSVVGGSNPHFSAEEWSQLRNVLQDLRSRIVEGTKDRAIASTAQTLAHDVGKPFAMLEAVLQVVFHARDLDSLRAQLAEMSLEIKRTMLTVSGLIRDVLEIDANAPISTFSASPRLLIATALQELFLLKKSGNVALYYSFQHSLRVLVDDIRVLRVFANILQNSLEAMGNIGSLDLSTRDIVDKDGSRLVEFTIANSGPTISDEDLPHLFEAFYSRNKRNGTGLGLAISKRIVEKHKGHLWCSSNLPGRVAFSFTIAASNTSDLEFPSGLHTNSVDFQSHLIKNDEFLRTHGRVDDRYLDQQILLALRVLGRPLKILVVDDDDFTGHVFRQVAATSPEIVQQLDISQMVELPVVTNRAEVLDVDLIFLDILMDGTRQNAIDYLKKVKGANPKIRICIHSGGATTEDLRAAMVAGADYMLPKPLPRYHFFRFLLESLSNHLDESRHEAVAGNERQIIRPSFAVVDDDIVFRNSWKIVASDAEVRLFASPGDFWAEIESDVSLLESFSCIVIDQIYASGDPDEGLRFAVDLRKVYDKPIILSSAAPLRKSVALVCIDVVLDKTPQSFLSLQRHLKQKETLELFK